MRNPQTWLSIDKIVINNSSSETRIENMQIKTNSRNGCLKNNHPKTSTWIRRSFNLIHHIFHFCKRRQQVASNRGKATPRGECWDGGAVAGVAAGRRLLWRPARGGDFAVGLENLGNLHGGLESLSICLVGSKGCRPLGVQVGEARLHFIALHGEARLQNTEEF